ncbi:MAG: glycoside hydrolase family 31 protein, partial [Kiritimatiellia bacterium]
MLAIRRNNESWTKVAGSTAYELSPGDIVQIELALGGHWYGHGFNQVQPYPLETGSIVSEFFAVNNIQNPIWMCSAGYALCVQTRERLTVRINHAQDGLLSISSPAAPCTLSIVRGRTLPEAQRELLARLGWPNRPPPARILGDCFFCTWTQLPRCINQEHVLGMAHQIRDRGYPCSIIILDDRWETHIGELEFSADFPEPEGMISELHSLGFEVWLLVTPFVNEDAATFRPLTQERILVPRRNDTGAALLEWWGGRAGIVDLTNSRGRTWFGDQLLRLRAMGVNGFKIDGGDFKYLPSPELAAWHSPLAPSGYSDLLLDLFEEVAPGRCETRTAWLSQNRNILWREGGKDSHWGLDNGLKAMVTLALHLAVQGYDVLIPDMIPGRVQTLVANTPLPTDELMLRWTEVTAFMPIMQFSYFPWNYAEETESAVRVYALVHKQLEPYFAEQSQRRNESGPLLRPLWYDAPE